jgi:hypothetical protein
VPAYWTQSKLSPCSNFDDLKELIGNHYSAQLFEETRKQYAHATTDQLPAPQGNHDDDRFL